MVELMTERPFTIVKRQDLTPLCPHCEQELTEVYARTKGVALVQGQNVAYFCPHCRKILGFGQGRMV
jgi:uncharacterized protein with PIN domain